MNTELPALPEAAFDALAVLYAAAYSAWTMTLSRSGFESGAYDWMKKVEPGHMVIETTAGPLGLMRKQPDTLNKAIGRLESVAREPFHDDAAWEEVKADWEGQERPTELVYYVRNLDGLVCRWTNASFVRVPETIEPWGKR